MRSVVRKLRVVAVVAIVFAHCASAKTLDIYFIDVEGGQSTLIVTPQKEAFLVDTGFPAQGKWPPGNAREARDANRILAAARTAGVEQIDYLLITHFHDDHMGGVTELSQLLPIKTFIDHGEVPPQADQTVPNSLDGFKAYALVRATGKHLQPKPGDSLPLKGAHATIVSADRATLSKPSKLANGRNAACGSAGLPAQETFENPRSTGVLFEFGKFRFLDLGDLSGPPLFALACPNDMIGQVDVYLVPHHGGLDSAEPATFAAFKPRVAIMNNGASKGGAKVTYSLLKKAKDVGEVWQLHRSIAAAEDNFGDDHIANLDESSAHWIKITAHDDGSFTVVNGRTGTAQDFPKR